MPNVPNRTMPIVPRPSKKEVLDRIARREPVHTSETSAEAIDRGRAER